MAWSTKLALAMLGAMFILMLASSWNDSAIFDEVAHIGAGYAYLKYQDGRLNPEHPPLLKNFAALPLLFLDLKEDIKNQQFWSIENVNDRQWAAGNYLLYETGNDADQILFWSRLPTMILAIIFGWVLFSWVRNRYGNIAGLLTLFLFATSPTFIAHSRFVTTDLGAAFGFFLGIVFFLRWLEKQDLKSAVWLGVVFGIALLLKFSLVLLLPVYLILILLTSQVLRTCDVRKIRNLPIAALIALAVIYSAYIPQIWNYPQDQQIKDANYILSGYQYPSLAKLDFWFTEQRLTRPIGLYLQGFLMVARRTAGGNTAYFMGEVSSNGWWSYFPILALTKEQLGFYVLVLIALFVAIKNRAKPDFTTLSAILFIVFYWLASILNPLNIGVRHILPTFPFLYFLVAKGLISGRPTSYGRRTSIYLIAAWMVAESILAFPHYLSYYNILGGGIENGYKIATDSNYDWGQDLRRLKIWADENKIDKIYLDYFGGGSPKYYLGNKFEPWWSAKGSPALSGVEGYFAVSLNSLAGAQAKLIGDIQIKPEDAYFWLKNKTPIARGGSSILIFRIE